MIQPILINYHITGSNDYCNYCDELHYLKIYTGLASSGLGYLKHYMLLIIHYTLMQLLK